MGTLEYLLNGFVTALSLMNLLYCLIGVTVGMLIGVLPGIGPTCGTAILIPLTYGMDPVSAIIMLAGIYYGAMYGGTITSVLINTPGEASSVITCLDGYPLAKQGRAGVALGVSAIGSFVGGIIAIIGLCLIGPPIAKLALKFGPPEFFALVLLGMTMIISMMGKSMLKGFISAFIGLSLAMFGVDYYTGISRFTFGQLSLLEGLDTVTIAMGLFGITELMTSQDEDVAKFKTKLKDLFPRKEERGPVAKSILRGSFLGFVIGLLPGTNSVIPTILSYTIEKKTAKDPSRFGKGALEGVAGPETANNAYCGGALIPLFTLGIPSSPAIAVLLGAFVMHGLQPGPQLFQTNPNFVWGVIASMFIGNAILLIMNMPLAGVWAKLATVPSRFLYPIIISVAVVGCYSLKGMMVDVVIMLIFSVLGYIFRKADIPLAPMILAFILGKTMESSLLQTLTIFKGNLFLIFTRPISAVLMTVAIVVILISFIAGLKKKKGMLANDVDM